MSKETFRTADYVVFSLTVVASVAIGIYFAIVGRQKNTTLNYFHGDRKLHYVPVAISLVVTFQSSVMLLGFPAEVYLYGFTICLFNIGQCAAIYIATRIVVPLMYPLKVTSVYHYLQFRYNNNRVRLLTVSIGIISQGIYMGSVMFGPAIALRSVTEIPVWATILCIASAAVLYTSIGGILAVIWTDVFQCVIMLAGLIAILVKGTLDNGGVTNIYQANKDSGRLDIFNFDPDPTIRHSVWTVLIGSFVGSFSLTLSQSTVQRFSSTPSIKDANKVMYIAGPVFIALQFMAMCVGLVTYAYFVAKGCDPILSKKIHNPNQIVPFMISEIFHLYPGLSGLFISALFSASLSTLSSILAALSAVTVDDFIRPYFKASDKMLTVLAKVSVVVYGSIGMSVAFIINTLRGSLTEILFGIMGAATGPIVGIFFLSMFFRKSTDKGVVLGGVLGLLFSFWICIGSSMSKTLVKTPPLPLAPISMCQGVSMRDNFTFLGNSSSVFKDVETTTSSLLTNTHSAYTHSEILKSMTFSLSTSVNRVQTATMTKIPTVGLDKLYSLSYALFSTVGTLVTIFIGVVCSLVTYDHTRDKPDSRYILSLSDYLCCCFKKICYHTTRDHTNNINGQRSNINGNEDIKLNVVPQ